MVIAWLILGVILLAVEIHHFAFYSLFAAAGCFAATVVAVFFPSAIPVQVVTAIAVATIGIIAVRPLVSKRFHLHTEHGTLGRGVAGALVGEEVLTLDVVGDIRQVGHVRLAGERWLATSGSGAIIPGGTKVLVTGVEGTTLVVWPLDGTTALPEPRPEQAPDRAEKENP
jgi:membrane protein implicated in regulation of membrane protease activity